MHLVFLTSLVPDGAPATGYEIANAAIVSALRRRGARVTVLGFTWPGKTPSDPENTIVLGELDLRTDAAGPLRKISWLAAALARRQTFASAKLTGISESALREALAGIGPFDAYVINGVHMAAAFPGLFQDRPWLYVAHNVEFQSAAENAAAARDPVHRILYQREARLLEEAERRVCARARFVFTLAEEDRQALGVAEEGRSAALPLITREEPAARTPNRQSAFDAALLGTWTWQPNRIGLEWFLEEVVPHLPPDFTVAIGGRTPSDIRSGHPGVRFVGFVDDATDFVRSGRVVPLISRAGTGVQLKTIETFELGLPAVATSRSLRGIGHLPENCRVADDPGEFAQALVQLAAEGKDLDGAAFHRAQRAALDRRIALGLSALEGERREAVA